MSDNVCPACNKLCAKGDSVIVCNECSSSYHVGSCCDVTDRSLRSKKSSVRKNWKCSDCREGKTGESDEDATDKEAMTRSVSLQLATVIRKLDELMPLKQTVHEMECSVQDMSLKFDEAMKRLDSQEKDIKSLKKRVEKIENEAGPRGLNEVQEAVNDLEWRSRRLNLEFHGLPVTPKEDLLLKLNELAPVLDLPQLALTDVTAIHRLPAKPDKIPGVIVRYNRQADRDLWLSKRAKLKEAKNGAFILENMTKRNRELLNVVKGWASENGFRFAWHANGKILLRKEPGDRVIVVKSEAQLITLRV